MIELTVENFEEKINEVVEFIRQNPPSTREEFKQYTKSFYGVELDCDVLVYPKGMLSVKYEIVQFEDDYSKCELYRMWDNKFGQYDGLQVLLDATFGELACGGVADSHYGQTKGLSEERRNKILENWDNTPNFDKVIKDYIQTQHELNKIFGS